MTQSRVLRIQEPVYSALAAAAAQHHMPLSKFATELLSPLVPLMAEQADFLRDYAQLGDLMEPEMTTARHHALRTALQALSAKHQAPSTEREDT